MASASQRAQPAPSSGGSAPTFTPDYIILGQLAGTTVDQSSRPRSVTLPENYQFAATYYGAPALQSAYGVDSFISSGYGGKGETIAIIDAYGDPTIYQDLATFDKEFGLPGASLTIIPVGPYEPSLGITYGWDSETALDVTRDCLHYHGGYGFTTEYDIQLYFRRAKAVTLTLGDPRAEYQRLADALLPATGTGA